MNELALKFRNALEEAREKIDTATSKDSLEAIRIEYLGRKGLIPALFREMGSVPAEEKPEVGQAANEAKNGIHDALTQALADLETANSTETAGIDVTLPGRRRCIGHPHPVAKVMQDAIAIFRRIGFVVAEGPEIENEYYNFDALNTPADHPARDVQDTFYLTDGQLLRTQTSPVQIRVMEKQPPPVRIICPGRCFRRDTPDASHHLNFHQIEGLYIDESVSLADLKGTLAFFASELLGENVHIQLRPHFFPFTEPSIEVDFSCIMCNGEGCRVCKYSGWLEVCGAGIVDPAVLSEVGYDPEVVSGFAFGMGIERIAMIRYGISDIRAIYENDMRFLRQFR